MEYYDFLKVFSEKSSECLPEHKPWDHVIDLKPGFVPKSSKIYPLSSIKDELTWEMIYSYLAQGTI